MALASFNLIQVFSFNNKCLKDEIVFAGRPLGVLWKVNPITGAVLSSLKFNITFGELYKFDSSHLLSVSRNILNIIDIKNKV